MPDPIAAAIADTLRRIGLLCEDPDCTAPHVDITTLDTTATFTEE